MKIKKNIIRISVLCFAIVSACQPELDLTNPNQLAPETFFLTPEQVQSSVNASYANMQTRGLWSRHMFFMMDNMSHENAGNPQLEADKRAYLEFSFNPSHGAIGAYWESCFRGINKANFVITNVDKINEIPDSFLPAATKAKYVGEAKFLRAFYYYLLVTRFGGVPLITTISESGDGVGRNTSEEVYQQILQDLNEAIPVLLPKGEEDNGRATQGAAIALLGKVHLYREEWQDAVDAFEQLAGMGYELAENYGDNFLEETEHNVESIFEIEYHEALGTSAVWNSDRSGAGPNEITFRGQEYGWNNWFNVYPSDDLIGEYEDGDPRYAANFYSNGDMFNNDQDVVELPLERVAGWRKYQNYYKQTDEQTRSSINFRDIRYADVLLMLAEAENNLGNSGAAIDYLNQVRDRVGMPNYGTPEMNALYPVGSQSEIFDAIVHERKVELAGEQKRFPDLVRWGLGGTIPNFVVGKHEVFPIPQIEIDANENLSQADQNPGY